MKALITKTTEPYLDGVDLNRKNIAIGTITTIKILGLPIFRKTGVTPDNLGIDLASNHIQWVDFR